MPPKLEAPLKVKDADPAFVKSPVPNITPAKVPALPWVTVKSPIICIALLVFDPLKFPIVWEKVFLIPKKAFEDPVKLTAPVLLKALLTPTAKTPVLIVVPPL